MAILTNAPYTYNSTGSISGVNIAPVDDGRADMEDADFGQLGKSGQTVFSSLGGGASTGMMPGGFNTLNQFGHSHLGTSLPGMQGSLTSSSLTGVAGAAGGIFAGYGAGTTVNSLLGGKEKGGQVGAGVGAAVGAIWGPVGSIIGGALGGAVGGLFGPGAPNPASEFHAILGGVGENTFMEKEYGTKHIDKTAAESVSGYLESYSGILKEHFPELDLKDLIIRGGFNKSGFFDLTKSGAKGVNPDASMTDDVSRIEFDISDPKDIARALSEVGTHIATTQGASQETIDKLSNMNVDALFKSQQFGGQNRDIRGVPLVLSGAWRGGSKGESTGTAKESAVKYAQKKGYV